MDPCGWIRVSKVRDTQEAEEGGENDIIYHLLGQVTNFGVYPKGKARPTKCYNEESKKPGSRRIPWWSSG